MCCTRLTAASASAAVIVWPCSLDSLNGKHGLAHVISTDCQGIIKSLSDDVLKVRVHAGYESAGGGRRKAPPGGRASRLE